VTETKDDERAEIRRYADVIAMWGRGFDTQSIADRVELPEHQVARWVANFRDVVRSAPEQPSQSN
jgi:superfamily II RNA helicase